MPFQYSGKGKLAAKTGQRAKKSSATVYFTHDMAEENSLAADARGVLQLHRSTLKKEMHLADPEFDAICKMIDRDDDRRPSGRCGTSSGRSRATTTRI